nr:MAG TPA_asm: protein of unknown function (DUF3483) [Caudoviricetes sp.]
MAALPPPHTTPSAPRHAVAASLHLVIHPRPRQRHRDALRR